jgi:hypothetical protein
VITAAGAAAQAAPATGGSGPATEGRPFSQVLAAQGAEAPVTTGKTPPPDGNTLPPRGRALSPEKAGDLEGRARTDALTVTSTLPSSAGPLADKAAGLPAPGTLWMAELQEAPGLRTALLESTADFTDYAMTTGEVALSPEPQMGSDAPVEGSWLRPVVEGASPEGTLPDGKRVSGAEAIPVRLSPDSPTGPWVPAAEAGTGVKVLTAASTASTLEGRSGPRSPGAIPASLLADPEALPSGGLRPSVPVSAGYGGRAVGERGAHSLGITLTPGSGSADEARLLTAAASEAALLQAAGASAGQETGVRGLTLARAAESAVATAAGDAAGSAGPSGSGTAAAAPTTLGMTAAPDAGQRPATLLNMLSAPTDPEFAPEFSGHLRMLVHRGGGEASLQLHPAELGRLQLTVSTDGDQARVLIVADSPAARDAIEQSMPRLRDLLEQSGLQLAQGDVSHRQEQAASDAPAESLAAGPATAEGDVDGSTPVDLRVTLSDRLFDAYA